MAFRRDLAFTMLLQGGGGAATLLAALWIGHALGPVQQGQFNQLKSLVDWGAALAALGMPQALYVYAQRGQLSLARAQRLARRMALLGLPAGLGLALWQFGGLPVLWPALALAVALATLHSQWRALALLGTAAWRFNLITIVPQWLLLAVAAGLVAADGAPAEAVAVALALVWLAATAYAGRALRRQAGEAASRERSEGGLSAASVPAANAPSALSLSDGAGLLRHGLATWVTASAAAGAIVLLQWLAGLAEGEAGLGRFALALLLVQLPLTPLNYAAPLLLRHRLQGARRPPLVTRLPWVLAPMLALAATVALAGSGWRSHLGLGPGYEGLHVLLAWLLVAGAAEAGMRLATVDAQAERQPLRSALAEVLRLGLLLLMAALGWAGSAVALAVVWALASWAALALLWWLARRAAVATALQADATASPPSDQAEPGHG